MKPKFFGQFLVERGYITTNQLRDSLEHQQKAIKRIGEIAVEQGFMTTEQAEKVNLEQRRTDKFLGELAVEMGFLTPEQLEVAVTIQKNNHKYLGEALVETGILTTDQVERYLDEFHEEQKPVSSLEKVIPEGLVETDEVFTFLDVSVKIFRRMVGLHLKFGKGYLENKKVENLFLTTMVAFSGTMNFRYFINVPAHVAVAITKNLYRDDNIECDDSTMGDCIGELANVICGNASSQILETGHKLSIVPPEHILKSEKPSIEVDENNPALIFPATVPLPAGYLDIGLLWESRKKERTEAETGGEEKEHKILIVDDSNLYRRQLLDLVKTVPGISDARAAGNGREALEIFAQFKPDIVIVDLVMPDIAGEEVVELILEQESDTKIIVLSGVGGSAEKILAELEAGVVAILSKPIDRETAIDAIKEALS